MNQDFLFTIREMNAMLTVVFLNDIISGGGGSVMVCASIAHGYRSPLVVTGGSLNAQRYRDDTLAHNNANISIFQHDNATSHTASDTVNFLRTNNIYNSFF